MSSLHRDDVTRLRAVIKAAAVRGELLERAVEGLSDEQIEAIPRLIAWFRAKALPQPWDMDTVEFHALNELFPEIES